MDIRDQKSDISFGKCGSERREKSSPQSAQRTAEAAESQEMILNIEILRFAQDDNARDHDRTLPQVERSNTSL